MNENLAHNTIGTPEQISKIPTTIRVSLGTALGLGLKAGRQEVAPTTAYLLWDEGCRGACSFCPRAGGNASSDKLSRVAWPKWPWQEVVERLFERRNFFRRICLQTSWHDSAAIVLPTCIESLQSVKLPLSLTLHPAQAHLVDELLALGLDHIGIGLDAATATTYALHKQRSWLEDWPLVDAVLKKHGPRIEIHLIFGLGDTEREFLATVEAIMSRGGQVALFAFTPQSVSQAERVLLLRPPDLSAWRRVQVFRYLRAIKAITWDMCRFDGADRLVSFGLSAEELIRYLVDGTAFQTAGCPDCNRPYYNERPGGILYNFPRPLNRQEVIKAISELGLPGANIVHAVI